MRTFVRPGIEHTIPASPRAKRLPQGSEVAVSLHQVRAELNVGRSEVARTSGLTEDAVQRLEEHQIPGLAELEAYARALGGKLEVSMSFGAKHYPLDLSAAAAEAGQAFDRASVDELDDPFPEPEPLPRRQDPKDAHDSKAER
jgi:transcriptional regulator with XRE-family HTH domain